MKANNKNLGLFSALALITLVIAASVAFSSWLFWNDRANWPVFPSDVQNQAGLKAAASPAPEVVASIERDYGWRIGDIVPATIFMKQKPGTVIDMHSIALAGDFELVGAPELFQLDKADGTRIYRAKVKLQSFSAVPQLALKANISYRVLSTNEDITVDLPAIDPFTSQTWDGRDKIQEGKLAIQHGLHGWITLAYFAVGLGGLIFFWKLIRYFRSISLSAVQKLFTSRFIKARRQFDAVWALMEAGDRSHARYVELSRIIRKLYVIETKTSLEAKYWYLYGSNGPAEIADMLIECDKVIYLNRVLSDEEHARIKQIFDHLVPVYSKTVDTEPEEV